MFKLIVLFLAGLAVQIRGPEKVQVGEILTLESATKDAVRTKWLVPSELKFISSGSKLHVLAEKPGTYTITFVGVDKEYNIEATTRTFTAEKEE